MLKIFIGRVLIAIPVLIVVASLTFFLIRMAPGGPFDSDRAPGDAQVEENLKAVYNLDAPLYEQYFDYMSGVFRGDFGPSFVYPRETVTDLIFSGLPVTFELALYALCFAIFLGIFSGIIAALNRNTFIDYFSMSIAMIGICVPTFLMGPALSLVFGINLGFLPVAGWGEEAGDKILPSITLGFAYAAYIARLSRGGMLEVLEQDYIRTARSKVCQNLELSSGMQCKEDFFLLFLSWAQQLQDYLQAHLLLRLFLLFQVLEDFMLMLPLIEITQ